LRTAAVGFSLPDPKSAICNPKLTNRALAFIPISALQSEIRNPKSTDPTPAFFRISGPQSAFRNPQSEIDQWVLYHPAGDAFKRKAATAPPEGRGQPRPHHEALKGGPSSASAHTAA
jgi:hypothetical protein